MKVNASTILVYHIVTSLLTIMLNSVKLPDGIAPSIWWAVPFYAVIAFLLEWLRGRNQQGGFKHFSWLMVPPVGLVMYLVGVIRVYQEHLDMITSLMIIFGSLLLAVGCTVIYLAQIRTTALGQSVTRPRYQLAHRWSYWGLAVSLVLVLLLGVAGWAYTFWQRDQPPSRTRLAVAMFDCAGSANGDTVTPEIRGKLRNEISKYPQVEVLPLGQTFREGEQANALDAAADEKATMLIWGWCRSKGFDTRVVAYVELLRQAPNKPLPSTISLDTRKLTVPQHTILNNSFQAEFKVSDEATYLALLAVGMILYLDNHWFEAISTFSQALNQTDAPEMIPAPVQAILFYGRGTSYIQMVEEKGDKSDNSVDLDHAIQDLENAVKLSDGYAVSAYAYHNLASAYAQRGHDNDYALAIHSYDEALKRDPTLTVAHYNRGLTLINHVCIDEKPQCFADAARSLETYVGYYPTNTDGLLALGLAYYGGGQDERAIAICERVRVEAKKQHNGDALAGALVVLSFTYGEASRKYVTSGNYVKAVDYIEALAAIDNANDRDFYNLAFAYFKLGRLDKSAEAFRRVIQVTKDDELRKKAQEALAQIGRR